MNTIYRYYLDGQLVNEPDNVQSYISSARRDYALNAILKINESVWVFSGEAHDYIKQKFEESDFCNDITLDIYEDCSGEGTNYEKIETGFIQITQCEFNRTDKTVKAKVIDDSFFARVKNNMEIKTSIRSGITKNSFDISPCPYKTMRMFEPCNGGLAGTRARSYRVYEVFKYLIRFMTDDQMEFDSPVFGTDGAYEQTCIMQGEHLRLNASSTSTPPTVSFKEMYDNFKKKLNLGFYIDTSGEKPMLVIDYDSNVFQDVSNIDLEGHKNIRQSFYIERMFTKVKFGNSIIKESESPCEEVSPGVPEAGVWPALLSSLNFIGFKEEEYTVLGQCNTNTTLDLTSSDFVFDTNTIEDILLNGNENYDESIIVVDGQEYGSGIYEARQGDIYNAGAAPYFYNQRFTNIYVSNNWLGGVPKGIAVYYEPIPNISFLVSRTSDTFANESENIDVGDVLTYSPMTYDVELSDTGGNYTSDKFVAPADGIYYFNVSGNFLVLSNYDNTINLQVSVNRYDASDVLIGTKNAGSVSVFYPTNPLNNTGKSYTHTFYMVLSAGQKIDLDFNISYTGSEFSISFGFQGTNTFQCTGRGDEGGELTEYDPLQYRCIKYDLSTIIDRSQFNDMMSRYKEKITLSDDCGSVQGWIDTLNYNRHTNEVQLVLIGKINNG